MCEADEREIKKLRIINSAQSEMIQVLKMELEDLRTKINLKGGFY